MQYWRIHTRFHDWIMLAQRYLRAFQDKCEEKNPCFRLESKPDRWTSHHTQLYPIINTFCTKCFSFSSVIGHNISSNCPKRRYLIFYWYISHNLYFSSRIFFYRRRNISFSTIFIEFGFSFSDSSSRWHFSPDNAILGAVSTVSY